MTDTPKLTDAVEGDSRPPSGSPSSGTSEVLNLMELIDCLCDAAWSHDKDDRTHYSARLLIFVEKIERKRDEALATLSAIDERYMDGDDTYEDWHFMGKTARDFLSENDERIRGRK